MADDLETHRKSFEEAQAALKTAVLEAARAKPVNKFRLVDVLRKYLEQEQNYLAKIHDRLMKLSEPKK